MLQVLQIVISNSMLNFISKMLHNYLNKNLLLAVTSMGEMYSELHLSKIILHELFLVSCGWESCDSGYTIGPAKRDHVLIHYVVEGAGEFLKNEKTISLSPGDGFVIFPGETTTYRADTKKPWKYYWVGFSGETAEKLLESREISRKKPLFQTKDVSNEIIDCIHNIYTSSVAPSGGEIRSMGLLLIFLSLISGESEKSHFNSSEYKIQDKYFSEALLFIQENLNNELSVAQIAAHISVDRTHLFRIFIQNLGISPQKFIINLRLKKVAQLLLETNLPICSIAESTGFSSATSLNVAFKREFSTTPKSYRLKNRNMKTE